MRLFQHGKVLLLIFFVLIGDSAGHGLADDHGSPNVLKSMSLVSSKLHEVFPDIPVFLAFGNNDLPGHYILPNNSDWYRTVLSYWAPLILCSECPDDVQRPTTMEALTETFMEGGYYSANIAGKIMIALKTAAPRMVVQNQRGKLTITKAACQSV